MKMAVSTRERLQTAKAYGVRVAAANSKASPRHPGPGQRGDEDRSPSGLVEQANPPARAAAVVRSTVAQFGAAEVEPSSPATVAAPEPSFSGLERRQNTAVEPASDPQPIPRASASLAARRRMASHSSGVHSAAEAAGLQALKAKAPHRTVDPSAEVAAAAAGLPPGASLATPSGAAGSHAKAVKARVLQPANASPSATGANKWWKGKPLPLAVSVRDEMGLARIAQKVSEMGPKLGLLRLCACPNKSSLFDPHYVQNCARNCPLFMKPVCYESLLTAWLREKGVI
ncbi:hypothetical protein PLESTF_001516700 [Pleodorina starrii]|nr:hypothetical protein PLESTF_001516700 [Pleodorina starrii]